MQYVVYNTRWEVRENAVAVGSKACPYWLSGREKRTMFSGQQRLHDVYCMEFEVNLYYLPKEETHE